MPFIRISTNIFAVGSSELSQSSDAYSYLVKTKNNNLVLIDCGVDSFNIIAQNIKETNNKLENLIGLILTHFHIDHIGSAHDFKFHYPKIKIYAHELDKDIIEGIGNIEVKTAAKWYGVNYTPVKVDVIIKSKEEKLNIDGIEFLFIHTPGHTPGSLSIIVEDDGKKILFGQDIHGPFMNEFDSNIEDWKNSMKILLSKEVDILAEGHYGIFKSKNSVKNFIISQLKNHE